MANITFRLSSPHREARTIFHGIVDPAAARVISLLCEIDRENPKDKTP